MAKRPKRLRPDSRSQQVGADDLASLCCRVFLLTCCVFPPVSPTMGTLFIQMERLAWPLPEGSAIMSESQPGEYEITQICSTSQAKAHPPVSSGRGRLEFLRRFWRGSVGAASRRSMTEMSSTARQPQGKAEVVEGGVGGLPPRTHMSLFHFELGMLAVLGVSLPIVYWRRMRIRHL